MIVYCNGIFQRSRSPREPPLPSAHQHKGVKNVMLEPQSRSLHIGEAEDAPDIPEKNYVLFETQIRSLSGFLEQAVTSRDLSLFYQALRASDLPFIMCEPSPDPLRLHRRCCAILHAFGGISPAAALALENHLYVASSIATLPSLSGSPMDSRHRELIERIGRERLLVANTNSKVQADKIGSLGTRAVREEGGFRVSGSAAYMSLATEGDLLVFVTFLENEGPAFFVTPLRGATGIEIGPYLLPNAMVESDTRQATFTDALLADPK